MNISYLPAGPLPAWQLLMLSAKSERALESGTEELIGFLHSSSTQGTRTGQGSTLANTAFTLLAGRELFDSRLALVCSDMDDAIAVLRRRTHANYSGRLRRLTSTAKNRPLAFLFADWDIAAMQVAGAIFASQPVFRTAVERCIGMVEDVAACDYLWRLLGGGSEPRQMQELPDQAVFAPIACFVFGYALASLWQSLGLQADVLIGDGTGELLAAHLAGYISLEDAVSLAVLRGRSLQHGMVDVASELDARIRGMAALELAPRRDYFSALAGKMLTPDALTSHEFWLQRVHQRVGAGISPSSLAHMAGRVVLDIGLGEVIEPTQTTLGTAALVKNAAPPDGVYWMLSTLGALVLGGVKIDWRAYFADKIVRRISLPTYCFEAQRHWFATQDASKASVKLAGSPPAAVKPPERSQHQDRHEDRQQAQPQARPQAHLPRPPQTRTETAAKPALHHAQVEKFLVEACQELLGIASIGLHDNVMQLGMDSMNVMQLSHRIEQAFKLTIAPHHLFSRPNIGSLLEKILALRPDLASAPVSKANHGENQAELAEMADFVATLSDGEVNRLLMELNAP
jgi:acyl transferase domain-containing protein